MQDKNTSANFALRMQGGGGGGLMREGGCICGTIGTSK